MSDPGALADPGVPLGLGALTREAAALADGRPLPPVHLWNPPRCGDIDIRIARDGTWFHEGAPIARPALVRLFSTVLRKDPDGFHLVTPAEKLRIAVEDAPFLAVALDAHDGALTFTTNLGDRTTADADHPIRVATDAVTAAPHPYVRVRGDLEARLTRPVFYELAELATTRDGAAGPEWGVESRGVWFPLAPAAPQA